MAFHALEKLINMRDGYQRAFRIAGKELLLIQQAGEAVIIENSCPHMGVPLTDASLLANKVIRCNAHGIEFELASGKAIGPLSDTLECLKKFPVVYEGNQLGVDC